MQTPPPRCRPDVGEDERRSPEAQAALERVNVCLTQPAPANNSVFTHNPLYSGSVMLGLLLENQEAGLSLANHHLSIFAAAHIYNALRQHKMLARRWPIMDRIIELHRRVLSDDAIPTRTEDMVKRSSSSGNRPRSQPLLSPLDSAMTGDRPLWQTEQQTKELLNEKQEQQQQQQPKSPARVSMAMQPRKQQVMPEQLVGDAQEAVSRPLDDLPIDYIRLTRRCLAPKDEFQGMWNVELEEEGMGLRFEPGSTSNDSALLIVCHEAPRRGNKGWNDDDPDESNRHSMGLLVAAKVYQNFFSRENSYNGAFMFPLGAPPPPSSPDPREVKGLQGGGAADDNAIAPAPSRPSIPLVIHRPAVAAELDALLASTTYVVVAFYTDYGGTHGRTSPRLAELAARYCKEGENRNKTEESSPAEAETAGAGTAAAGGSLGVRRPPSSSRTARRSPSTAAEPSAARTRRGSQGRGREAGWLWLRRWVVQRQQQKRQV
ncbi:hypothetical protein DL768_004869 [Monosporascus sp. mg162]|nr:hypothetical protein DL768_004869 [Monosporascus sp. mg162]